MNSSSSSIVGAIYPNVLWRLSPLLEEAPRPAPIIAGVMPRVEAASAEDADPVLGRPAAMPVAPLIDEDTAVARTGSFA